jgi:nitrous oxide reductase
VYPQNQPDPAAQPGPVAPPPSRLNRRAILRGAAGVGVVGIAAAAGAGAAIAVTDSRTPDAAPASKPVAMAAMPETAMAGPLVVYLRDTTTGEMDVFGGTGQLRLRDPGLVGQLLQAMK